MHSEGGLCCRGQLESRVQGAGLLHMLPAWSLSDHRVYETDVFACASASLHSSPPEVKMSEVKCQRLISTPFSLSRAPLLPLDPAFLIGLAFVALWPHHQHRAALYSCAGCALHDGNPFPGGTTHITDIADLCILLMFSSRWQ